MRLLLRAGAVALGALALGCAGAQQVPAAPAGSSLPAALAREITEGAARHREALARHGEWLADERFGTRWCPSQDASVVVNGRPFVPFRTGGRWERTPTGPAWFADASGSWEDVTAHAGWWVRHGGLDTWCWIPGTSASPGRVGWRGGGGYVGWVPLGPPDGDQRAEPPARAWTFTFLAALYEPRVSPLEGEAAEVALANAMPLPGEPAYFDEAPPDAVVDAARDELAPHLVYHRVMGSSSEPLPPSMLVWDALLVHPMQGAGAVVAHAGPAHIGPLVGTGAFRTTRRSGVLPLPGGRTVFRHAEVPASPLPRVGTVRPTSPTPWPSLE